MKIVKWIAVTLIATVVILIVGARLFGDRIYLAIEHDRFDTAAPKLPRNLAQPSVLVFSKTNGFRDGASIDAASAMFRDIARERGWGLVESENGALFNPAQLARFKVVVWNSVSGDVLTPEQKTAFQTYLEQGGGFVGIHGAGGDPAYRWPWQPDRLIGAQFIGHTMFPQFQRATIRVEEAAHPAMTGLPRNWVREEEWYSFDRSVRGRPGFRVLATVDESTYNPSGSILFGNLRMGDHPVIWTHCIGRGRAFYSALGHKAQSYAEPAMRQLLANAVAWAAGGPGCANGI